MKLSAGLAGLKKPDLAAVAAFLFIPSASVSAGANLS